MTVIVMNVFRDCCPPSLQFPSHTTPLLLFEVRLPRLYDTFLGAQPEVFIVISHPSLNREKGQAESAKPLALQFTAQMFAMAWIGSQLKPGYGDSVWVTQIDDKTSGTLAVTSCFPGCALVGSWLASGAGSGI